MLNVAFLFDDAVHALTRYAEDLEVVPLPAAVYMMQVDVIRLYHHALEHYLTVSLDARFLQNSSLGTPYQKWAYFTNEDFEALSFAIHNLLRYTSRLISETECAVLRGRRSSRTDEERLLQSSEEFWNGKKDKTSSYTRPISEIRYQNKSIGVRVHDDRRLSITRFRPGEIVRVTIIGWRTEPGPKRVTGEFAAGEPDPDLGGTSVDDIEDEHSIEDDEHEPVQCLPETIQTETIDIQDRSRLLTLREEGRAEIAELRSRNRAFADVCDAFYRSRSVVQPFENVDRAFWI